MNGIYVNDNIPSINAQGNLLRTQESLNKHINRLSSGYRVSTARVLGYYGSKLDLLNPVVNIHYGVKYLVKLASRYKYGWDVVSAYNCGRPHWRRGLGFMCLGRKTDYVQKVAKRFKRLKERKERTNESFRLAEYHPFFGVVPQE